jgi:hypothetical protein
MEKGGMLSSIAKSDLTKGALKVGSKQTKEIAIRGG